MTALDTDVLNNLKAALIVLSKHHGVVFLSCASSEGLFLAKKSVIALGVCMLFVVEWMMTHIVDLSLLILSCCGK